MRITTNCWPTGEQEALLQAALLKGEIALDSWRKWRDLTDIDDIDFGSHRLLPLLYQNLTDHKVNPSELGRIKGVYKRTWVKNQILFKQARPVLEAFIDAGIEAMLLKGAAHAIRYHDGYGVRPMEDIDILVKEADILKAIEIIKGLGWRTTFDSQPGFHPLFHAAAFLNDQLGSIDLHWYLILQDTTGLHEAGYWNRAQDASVEGFPVKILSPADQLLHICVHGLRWSSTPSIRWIADAFEVLTIDIYKIDWEHIVHHANNLRLSMIVHRALQYLKDAYNVEIPDIELSKLEGVPVSWLDKLGNFVFMNKPIPVFGNFISYRLFWYLLYVRGRYPFPGFLRYIQELWSVRSMWQIPFEGLLRGIRGFRTDILKQPAESVGVSTVFRKR